ncbi:branched-chain amino acid ABC transporter permease [Acrocarpospora pleiomorpha]|uniref:Branched-chain amino acid ABC transporter permease n=1 Tax=Acrocarpospora pleiomorpha TaxID=90975 RepID=A0A5M3XF53_9ACTN|nr:branched-chain amino acid ABC transporter permease [Acrocarpospora pleiomorpha]GES19372.1 branched-chain amino acid ABC transporter permease [Acrocarpospora pleiomorpha]
MWRPSGYFATSYIEDIRLLRTRGQKLALVFGAIVLLVLPLALSPTWTRFATVAGITVVAVVGLQMLMGSAGQVSIGQAAFMGVGAYATAFFAIRGFPFPLPILLGAVCATIVGALFGGPAARIRGFYLALTTLAAQYVFVFTVVRLPADWFGGVNGLSVPLPTFGGIDFFDTTNMYYLVLPFVVVMVAAAIFINAGKIGRDFIAVREDDNAAAVLGVNVARTKIKAFGLSSFYAGIAGGLLAYQSGLAHFEQYQVNHSLWFIGMLIIGGMGSTLGAVLGTFLILFIEELLNNVAPQIAELGILGKGDIVYPLVSVTVGLLVILVIIKQPRGLAHIYRTLERKAHLWPFPQ